MSSTLARHPIFARFFDRLSRLMEREAAQHRQELLAALAGRVLEIGAGNGINRRCGARARAGAQQRTLAELRRVFAVAARRRNRIGSFTSIRSLLREPTRA
jgi:hypothetical protein